MNFNNLIDLYKENIKKNPGKSEIFEPLKKLKLNISNNNLCKLLKLKTGNDWEIEICLDRDYGYGPDKHPLPWCYDLILTPKDVKYHEGYAILHASYSCRANVVGTESYNIQEKSNKASKEKLENANWAELFLNAENRNGTLYCGELMKAQLPNIVQETLTEFMFLAVIQNEKDLKEQMPEMN